MILLQHHYCLLHYSQHRSPRDWGEVLEHSQVVPGVLTTLPTLWLHPSTRTSQGSGDGDGFFPRRPHAPWGAPCKDPNLI